ncbi:MAG TPA: hypothetical protein DCE56_13855 [Cyanobacteria bacterium UBA8553]|nr:hypothetical protein [Cyanobacteria bacterium UBA8553]
MKSESWMWTGIKVALVIAGLIAIAVGLKYISERTDIETQAEIDTWVNQRLAEALSRKLNQPAQVVGDALKKPSASPLAEQIEQIVQSVTVTFQRLSSSKFQIQLNLLYKDDTAFSTAIEKEWDDLPATVRKEFLQTEHQTVRRTWICLDGCFD